MKKSGTGIRGRQSALPAPRHLPWVDILVDAQAELQELVVASGLKVLAAMVEADRVAVCGPRYAHQPARRASRAGHAPSEVVLGGRKVALRRPRVRRDGQEVALPSVQAFTNTDPLTRRVVEQMLIGVATRQYGRSLKRFSNRPCTTWGGRGTSARTDAGGPMRAYSMDLRERARLDSDAGMKAADVAAKYRVSGSWVRLLKQRRRETGEVAPRVQRHGRRGMLEPHLHTVADLIAAHPDRTLAELKDALATPARVPTVWRAVRALGLTVKKNGPPVRTRSA